MTIATQNPVRVEIWSDPQCVWCFIAHPRFEKAVTAFDGDVQVTYRSFELRPSVPIEINKDLEAKGHAGAGAERIEAINRQLAEIAAAEGISYRPDLTRPTNSHLALELLHHADESGHRAALTKRIFTAYFPEGRHIGHQDELVDLAHDVGLDRNSAREALTDRRYREAVDQDSNRLRELGASGVPLYVINGQWGISGAQPVQTYLDALENALRA